jgi:hypothetical protein
MDVERVKKDIRDKGRSDTSVRLVLTLIRQVFNRSFRKSAIH